MDPKKAAEMQKMMEAMQAYGALGPEHAKLKSMAGSWDVATKMWMEPACRRRTSGQGRDEGPSSATIT
jgi:hypothetical protein